MAYDSEDILETTKLNTLNECTVYHVNVMLIKLQVLGFGVWVLEFVFETESCYVTCLAYNSQCRPC